MKIRIVCAVVLLASAITALAGPVEDTIRYRQSAFTFIGWNVGKIQQQVVEHPETYNKEQVIAAANAIAAAANSGLGALFVPGTDKGTGWRPTELKAEFFQKPDEAKQVATAFTQEANAFAKVAAQGDTSAIKTEFAKLRKTCKGCHDNFRERD
jgi:cytochrome c556